jgi:hypothetical protein
MPPPQPFEFPFTEAATLQTAMSDLKAALDGLVLRHVDHVDDIQGPGSVFEATSGAQVAFSGAARGAFDTLFEAALDAVATVAGELAADMEALGTAVGEAYTAAAERAQEIAEYRETHQPRPTSDPDARAG